jgi:hypothetical protein
MAMVNMIHAIIIAEIVFISMEFSPSKKLMMVPMLRLNGGHRSKKKCHKPHIPTVDPLPNRPEKIIMLSNEAFSDYYSQQLGLDNHEFQLFMASLKSPLPVSFRFTGSRDYADDLNAFMVNIMM